MRPIFVVFTVPQDTLDEIRKNQAVGSLTVIAYSADDARKICGRKSGEIETILGYRGRDEMIHRDDLALTRA